MSTVTIVIVNYKMKAMLAECVQSVFENCGGVDIEIIVVDNASEDGIAADFAKQFPTVKVIENIDNAGFARACNQGAAAGRGEYVLFLNPDTEMLPGTLDKMVSFLEQHPDAGIVGPRTVNTDGSHEPSVYNFPSVKTTLVDVLYLDNIFPKMQGYERKFYNHEPVHEIVQVICGACLMTRRALIDEHGAFDEQLWMYGEDVEMCRRYLKAGYSSYFLKDCSVIHKRGKKHLDDKTEYDMSRIIYWHYRWIFYYLTKHSGPISETIIRKLLYLNIISKYVPRKKKITSGMNTSKDNLQRVAAFERILKEFFNKSIK